MKQTLLYIKLEFKRFIKLMPGFLAGAAALSLLAVLIAFCAENILSPDTGSAYKVKVALVFDDSSSSMQMLTDILKDSDCISSTCELINTDIETAKQMVESGEATASLIIPKGFVENVRRGANPLINIYFADNSTIIALILKQLSISGAGMLSSVQAGIFTQYDIYKKYGFLSHDSEAKLHLNGTYLKYVLRRGTMFRKIHAYPTGNLSITNYYKCAGAALVLLFISISCSSFLCISNPSLEAYLSAKGISHNVRFLTKLLVLTTFSILIMAIPFHSIKQLAIILPAIICSSSIAIFIYRICSSPSIGIFAVFIFNFISAFLSGYFIPVSFMPDIIQQISAYIPANMIFRQFKYMSDGGTAATLILLIIAVFMFFASAMADRFYHRGGNLN